MNLKVNNQPTVESVPQRIFSKVAAVATAAGAGILGREALTMTLRHGATNESVPRAVLNILGRSTLAVAAPAGAAAALASDSLAGSVGLGAVGGAVAGAVTSSLKAGRFNPAIAVLGGVGGAVAGAAGGAIEHTVQQKLNTR